MAILRYIEINVESEELTKINQKNGQIIFCRDTLNVYCDTNDGHRYSVPNLIIKVNSLPTKDIESQKLYYLNTDRSLYRYYTEWIKADSSYDIFDLIADNEDVLGGYLTKNYRLLAPITSSELVYRPDGDTIEESLIDHEKEIHATLDPLHRYIYPDTTGQTKFILPVPYKTFLAEFNMVSIFKNKQLMTDDMYTLNYTDNTVTFNTGVNKDDIIEVTFQYIRNEMKVVSEYFQAKKDQTVFTLKDNTFLIGKNLVSLYINGIKQPKEAFTEVNNKTIKLNSTIPKDSFVVIEIGKWIPHDNDFYSYFETKVERKISLTTIEVTYPVSNTGHSRKIIKSLDSNGNCISEIAYVDNKEVCRMTIQYDNDMITYTKTP